MQKKRVKFQWPMNLRNVTELIYNCKIGGAKNSLIKKDMKWNEIVYLLFNVQFVKINLFSKTIGKLKL